MNIRQYWNVYIYAVFACGITSQANASSDGAAQKVAASSQTTSIRVGAQPNSAQVLNTPLNQCVIYTYDKNGNRITQVNAAVGAGVTWGTPKYLCFIWGN